MKLIDFNNPLHSLIYSSIENWDKILIACSPSEILLDINIIRQGEQYNEDVKQAMIKKLVKRNQFLKELIDSGDKILEILKDDAPITSTEQAFAQGYLSDKDAQSPYRHISKKLNKAWTEGRLKRSTEEP